MFCLTIPLLLNIYVGCQVLPLSTRQRFSTFLNLKNILQTLITFFEGNGELLKNFEHGNSRTALCLMTV